MKELIGEVKQFLLDLKLEIPEIFGGARAVPGDCATRPVGRTALFEGKELQLRWRESEEKRTRVELLDGMIVVARAGDGLKPREALRGWYAAQAKRVFPERVAHWSERMGLKDRVRRVFIKDQRSLWGSCSQAGNLNFNWRVVQAPPAVLDYLVIHELAHLREMNHSKRFWAHVSEHCPDYKLHRKWLREQARALKGA